MNSRERVLATLDHKEPDKVPLDLGSSIVTSLTIDAYVRLREYLKMPPDPEPAISDVCQGSIYPREDFFERYEIDFRPVQIKGPTGFEPELLPGDSFYDEYGVRWKKASYYYDAIERPLADCETVDDLERATSKWIDPYNPGRFDGLREEARALFENTGYAIMVDHPCNGPFEQACTLRGYEEFLVDLQWNPNFAQALLNKITEFDLAIWERLLDEVGDYAQVVMQGDDIAMQRSLFISPETYRKFIKPCQRRIFDLVHSKTDAKVFFHSDGSIYDIIPDLIEIGVDILNPIQRSAAKMDIVTLKKEFGDALTFFGAGIDVQQVLPFASLEEIEDDVKRTLDIMMPGGGFIFVPTHNIQPDVTPDRIHKVYETVLKYRAY